MVDIYEVPNKIGHTTCEKEHTKVGDRGCQMQERDKKNLQSKHGSSRKKENRMKKWKKGNCKPADLA